MHVALGTRDSLAVAPLSLSKDVEPPHAWSSYFHLIIVGMSHPKSQAASVLKVVILGDGGVGKSSLMNRFVNNEFNAQSFHTIGVEFLNKDIHLPNQDETYTLQIVR
jgi:polynucleotide 5'-kinase involved in rRNA processing